MTTSTEAAGKRAARPGRRQEIVAIAMELFAKKGVQATGVREIADHAGILSGSLYSHFESKDEILELGLRPYLETYLRLTREVVERDTEPVAKVSELLRQSFSLMLEWRAATIVMHSDWEYISSLDGFAFLREFYAEAQDLSLRALREAVASGAFAPDVDPEVVLRLLSEIMWGTARRYHPGSRFTVEVMTDYVQRMFFGGLGAPRSAP